MSINKLFSICKNFNKNKPLAPINYECIDKTNTWVVEDKPPLESKLNLKDLENLVAQVEGEG